MNYTIKKFAGMQGLTVDTLRQYEKKGIIRPFQDQENGYRCGDNGIFKGIPLTKEQKELSKIAREIYTSYPFDGKYILDGDRLILCQSNQEFFIL